MSLLPAISLFNLGVFGFSIQDPSPNTRLKISSVAIDLKSSCSKRFLAAKTPQNSYSQSIVIYYRYNNEGVDRFGLVNGAATPTHFKAAKENLL